MKKILIGLVATAAITASSAKAAIDTCVVGTWWADISDIADMLSLQMNGPATPVSGDARMDVTADGSFRITVRDMTIKVTIPNSPPVDVSVVGYSAGSFDATDGVWLAGVADYSLTGSADVFGETMTLPFTSATGMFGGGLGGYTCSADLLRLDGDPTIPMRFVRNWKRG